MKMRQLLFFSFMLIAGIFHSYAYGDWKGKYSDYFDRPLLFCILKDGEKCQEYVSYCDGWFEYYISYPVNDRAVPGLKNNWTVYEGNVTIDVNGDTCEWYFMRCRFASIYHRLHNDCIEIRYRYDDSDRHNLLFAMKRNPLIRFEYYDIHKGKDVVVNIPLINFTAESERLGL